VRRRIPTPLAVGALLLASYAFFWQSRDWNSASRLMLTYALIDRGTIAIDGLEVQTGDKAYFEGHYYTDKLPGFSLLAVPSSWLAKAALRLPDHPLGGKARRHWPTDYWASLGTSGLLTACAGALLTRLAADLGCGPRRSALVGLAYGLATPAYAYATMSYGHQASSFCLLASFALLWEGGGTPPRSVAAAAGALAALAAAIELQVGPVSAILGLYLLARVAGRQWPVGAVATFAAGAAGPSAVLLIYNLLAYGSPWDMGYFHEVLPQFAEVHAAENPIGLRSPDWRRAVPLLWGGYRGLLFYAPIVALALPGWVALIWRRAWGMAAVSASACAAVFLVNLSYPEWTGGWSTGPRLLVPMLPFAMLAVAGLLAALPRVATTIACVLALAGWVLMTLFVGVGTGVPADVADPLGRIILRHWSGRPLLLGWPGGRFTRNIVAMASPGAIGRLPESWRWLQFAPLIVAQATGVGWLLSRSETQSHFRRRKCA
jgi:hypothetical protein